jgi:hypothetical protein
LEVTNIHTFCLQDRINIAKAFYNWTHLEESLHLLWYTRWMFSSVNCKLWPLYFWIHCYQGEFSLSLVLFGDDLFSPFTTFSFSHLHNMFHWTVVSNQTLWSLHTSTGKVVTTKVASKLHPKSEKWKLFSVIVRDRRRSNMGRINTINSLPTQRIFSQISVTIWSDCETFDLYECLFLPWFFIW